MPKTADYFVGRTLFVTGAASGIGRATALIFAREGADVACVDIDADGAERTAGEIVRQGRRGLAIACDVRSREAVRQAIRRSIAEFGRIDFQFNSAGAAGRRSAFLDIDDALWERTYDLNVKGTFYAMQEVLPHMLEAGSGVIVNVSSMSHKRGGAGQAIHYASAKGAVFSMTLGVAREFAGRGIRALSISPGPIDTPFQEAARTTPEMRERFLADVPMGRFGRPEEIGELVLFLCSDACEFMTADTVYVNGGGGWR
ncbi:MAG: SDR family NAD(P)-dependent oxidoreductase [Alphaproteobacteria bacterium]